MTHDEARIRREHIFEELKKGRSDLEIAQEFGVSWTYVRDIASSRGLLRDKARLNSKIFLILRYCFIDRLSQAEIARKLSVSRQRVHQILQQAREAGWHV